MNVLSKSERAKIGIDAFVAKRKSKLCWLFHDWQPWKITARGNLSRSMDGGIVGSYIRQERYCGRCNKIEIKDVESITR